MPQNTEQKSNPITVTVEEALRLIGIKRTFFYSLLKDGKIKTIKIGNRRLVIYTSLEELVNVQ